MKYSLTLPNGGPWSDPKSLARLAHTAEAAGWDGIFLEDYIVWQSNQQVPTYDTWILLSAMAAKTRHIRLGTMVTALARRRPWKLAREALTLDHLSNGRLILGVGLGDTGESIMPDISFTHFSETLDPRRRAGMLDEALEIITGLWSGAPFHYEGSHYRVKEVAFSPPPLQQPRIPIWVGGAWPLRGPSLRAARWDGACLYRLHGAMTRKDIRDLAAFVREQRGSLEGYDILISGAPHHAGPEQQRRYLRSMQEAGATWSSRYLPPGTGSFKEVQSLIARGPLRAD